MSCQEFENEFDLLVAGELDDAGDARLRAHAASCPHCQRELAWLDAVHADLDEYATAATRGIPEVDLVDGVMATISRPVEVKFEKRPRRLWAMAWAGLAAAAILVMGAWLAVSLVPTQPVSPTAGGPQETQSPDAVETVATPPGEVEVAVLPSVSPQDVLNGVRGALTDSVAAGSTFEATQAPDLATLSLDDVIKKRLDAKSDGNAYAELRQWATLTPEEALAVLDDADASPEAIAGAAAALGGETAEQFLISVIGHLPEEPYLRLQLAEVYLDNPEQANKVAQYLADLKALDPDNALVCYLEAKLCLDSGDIEGALAAFEEARELKEASAYALQAAACGEEALAEAGLDADAAQVLTALTAGGEEYDFLCDLGSDLLEYAEQCVEIGDLASAQAIFDAVHRLGLQVEEGAAFALEQLAGLDLQRVAVEGLREFYATVESVEGIEQVAEQALDLTAGFEDLVAFFDFLNGLLVADADAEFWTSISDVILQVGDLMAGDYLKEE